MADRRPTLPVKELVLSWILAFLQSVALLAFLAWLLSWPAVFKVYYPAMKISTGTADAVQIVKWLARRDPPRVLNAGLSSGQLSAKEVAHFAAVRKVFHGVPGVLGATGLFYSSLLLWRRFAIALVIAAQWRSLCLLVLASAAVAGLAAWDWKTLFAWLHLPLFGTESWRFPASAYSLQLFPAVFWQLTGASVAVVSVTITLAVLATMKLCKGLASAKTKAIAAG